MLILASQSPSRRAMLTAAGVPHSAHPAHLDEAAITAAMRGDPVRNVADKLAELKAVKVSLSHPGAHVLGSDSMLEVAHGQWLEKPGTLEGLRTQLQTLRARPHKLVSAAVIAKNGQPIWRHVEVATLHVRPFSDQWLESYIATAGAQVLHSVGGYHLEAQGVQLFEKIEGDQFSIRGLPLLAVLAWLREAGEMPQ
jgi:septum formation protein